MPAPQTASARPATNTPTSGGASLDRRHRSLHDRSRSALRRQPVPPPGTRQAISPPRSAGATSRDATRCPAMTSARIHRPRAGSGPGDEGSDAVRAHLAGTAPLLPGARAGQVAFVDIDPTDRRVHSRSKQGSEVGRFKTGRFKGVHTLHPTLVTISTPLARGRSGQAAAWKGRRRHAEPLPPYRRPVVRTADPLTEPTHSARQGPTGEPVEELGRAADATPPPRPPPTGHRSSDSDTVISKTERWIRVEPSWMSRGRASWRTRRLAPLFPPAVPGRGCPCTLRRVRRVPPTC